MSGGDENRSEARPFSRGDLALAGRLWPLTAPFRGVLVLGVAMIVLSAVVSLLLPYLTKVAIDRHILPMGRVILADRPGDVPADLLGALGGTDLTPSGLPGALLVAPDRAALIDRRQERALVAAGLMDPGRWYIARPGPAGSPGRRAAEAVKAALPRSLLSDSFLAVREGDLPRAPRAAAMVLREADIRGLGRLAIMFAVLMAAGYGLDLGQRYFMESASQRLGHAIRARLAGHLYGLSQGFFDRSQTARLTSRLTSDVNNINSLVKSTAASFFSDVLSLAGVVAIMAAMSPKLALTAMLLTPLAAALSWRFSLVARRLQRDLRAKVAAINQAFGEISSGMAVIKAFRQEDRIAGEFEALNHDNYLTGWSQLHSVAVFLPLVDLCSTVVLALILWVGGLAVLDNTVSLGVLAAFVGYATRFFNPIKDLAEKVNTFQGAFASLERIAELMDEDDRTKVPPNALAPVRPGGAVELRGVSLRYDPGSPLVLDSIDLSIARGESVALVGGTGSGKTSLINLILRFYDPTAGAVLMDGVDLRLLDLGLHRRRVGLVTQDVYLYSASVLDNLRLGRSDLGRDQIVEACRAVGAHGFISALPAGYDEPLGPGGRGLSAGQKQLLACARALIDTPELVILDEATAFVDSETELLIERAMMTIFEGRTSIVIAHRLSTIRRVDRILVLHHGRLVESGDHESLMARQGIYHHLASLQSLARHQPAGGLGKPPEPPGPGPGEPGKP